MKLTNPQKIAFIFLGLLVAVGLYRFFTNKAQKESGQDQSAREKAEEEDAMYEQQLQEIDSAGIVQTYPSSKYQELADGLEQALSPSWFFTDVWGKSDKCRYYIAHCHNIKDWTLLKKAFGYRPHCTIIVVPYNQCPKRNLTYMLNEELSRSKRREINDLFAARGIPATV